MKAPDENNAQLKNAGPQSAGPQDATAPVIRFGIGKKLNAAFLGVTALTVVAIGVALVSYTGLGDSFDGVTKRDLPAISAALRLEKEAISIVAVGSAVASAKTEAQRGKHLAKLSEKDQVVSGLIDALSAADAGGKSTGAIHENYAAFSKNMAVLKTSIDGRLKISAAIKAKNKLMLDYRQVLGGEFENIMDAQRSGIIQAMRNETPDEIDVDELRNSMMRVVFGEIDNLQAANKIQSGADQLVAAMSEAVNAPSPKDVETLVLRFTEFSDISRQNIGMMDLVSSEDGRALVDKFELLAKLGEGTDSIFELRKKELAAVEAEKGLLAKSAELTSAMGENANALVALAETQIAETQDVVGKTVAKTTWWLVALAALSILGTIFIATFYVRKQIVARLRHISDCMSEIADGNLETRIPRGGQDEITAMALAVRVFRENAKDNIRLEAEQKEMVAQTERNRRKILDKMATELEAGVGAVVNSLSGEAETLQSSATELLETSAEANERSETITSASAEASENVEAVAAAAEELSNSIREIGQQVMESSRVADSAVEEANKSTELVQGLSEASMKIGDVVNLITDIAEQTNLLALNATIEAARAGDAGKGFAVVASEVKNLANQTAKATDEINQQISGVQKATKQSAEAIEQIGGTIQEISEFSSAIAAAVEQQGAATQEIAANIDRASSGTQNVSNNIAGVSQAASRTDASAQTILSNSKGLKDQSEMLKQEVDKFLVAVRTG